MSMMTYRHRNEREAAYAASLGSPKATKTIEKPVEKPIEDELKEEVFPTYTKSEITRATTENLKEIATEVGIEGAEDKTGSELKKLIIEKLGL